MQQMGALESALPPRPLLGTATLVIQGVSEEEQAVISGLWAAQRPLQSVRAGEGMTSSGRHHGSPFPLNKHPHRNRPHLGLIGQKCNVDFRQRLDDFGCSGFYQLVKQGIWTCCKNEKRQWGFCPSVCPSIHLPAQSTAMMSLHLFSLRF